MQVTKLYIVPDGSGGVVDYGAFGTPNPAGTYSVQTTGAYSMTLNQTGGDPSIIISGQLSSFTEGTANAYQPGAGTPFATGTIKKVDPATCAGVWGGTLNRASPVEAKVVQISVGSSGIITDATGLAPTVSGRFYSVDGHFTAMIRTGEVDAWNQVQLTGTLSVNTVSGSLGLDASAPDDTGTFSLTRP